MLINFSNNLLYQIESEFNNFKTYKFYIAKGNDIIINRE